MKLVPFLLVCFLSGAILGACGPSQPEVDTEATIAAGIAATQTAVTPLDTPTPVPTDTPTPAPTDTPTSIPTDTPTLVPTEEPTEEAATETSGEEAATETSGIVLELKDLPSGFEEIDPAEMGMTKETMSNEQFEVEEVFAFIQPTEFEIVMGFTTLLNNKLEQAGFDAALRDPELLSESFVGGMGGTDVLEQEELVLEDIGNEASGLSFVVDMTGVSMRMDLAVFRKDKVGAFLIIMYMDGEEASVSIADLARTLANKVE